MASWRNLAYCGAINRRGGNMAVIESGVAILQAPSLALALAASGAAILSHG
jgi:hypothetical protein